MSAQQILCVLITSAPDSKAVHAFTESCFRFTPKLALRDPPEAVFLDLKGCEKLYSAKTIEERVRIMAGRFGVAIQMAWAHDPALALVRAKTHARLPGQSKYLQEFPLATLTDFISPFRSDEETRKELLTSQNLLAAFGIKTLADLARLPGQALVSRFGKKTASICAQVQTILNGGTCALAWPRYEVSRSIFESQELPEEVDVLEPVFFVLKAMLEQLFSRVRGRAEKVAALCVELDLRNKSRSVEVRFPLAQGSAPVCMLVLREKLSSEVTRNPLDDLIRGVKLSVLETVPGAGAQRDLFSQKEEQAEAWDDLVSRLTARLGLGRVFVPVLTPSFLPEKTWARQTAALNGAQIKTWGVPGCVPGGTTAVARPWPERPLRMLAEPCALRRRGPLLELWDQASHQGVFQKRSPIWRVLSWEGPERISAQWWERSPIGGDRDYYRIKTQSGEWLWVFHLNGEAQSTASVSTKVYLHGFFD
ncbi:hypothetical protein WDW86_17690 [Bdellovibrionota bacterium FG-2]